MIARHRRKALEALDTDRGMAQLSQCFEIAAGTAAQIENRERRLSYNVAQQGLDILADGVSAGAFPERVGTLAVAIERTGDDRCHRVGPQLDLHGSNRLVF